MYGPDGSEVAVMSGSSVISYYLNLPGGATAVYNSGGLNNYWHPDWLGTPRLYSSPTRTVLADLAFGAYGEQYQGPVVDSMFTGVAQVPEANDLRTFPARNLSVVEGWWMSPDPAGLSAVDLGNPQSLNRYAYVMGNPFGLVDPSGMCPQGATDCFSVSSKPACQWWQFWCYGIPGGSGTPEDAYQWPGATSVPTVGGSSSCDGCGGSSGGSSSSTSAPAKNGACANSALSAAGVDIVDRIAKTNALLAADYDLAAKSNGQANGSVMALMTYYSLVHTGGPQDDKNHPGPGTQQQRIDAGNVSFGVTCPFGATFCQAAAGGAQAYSGLLNIVSFGKFGHGRPGPASTFFDSPSDNASIKVGQAMRAAGCS